METRPATRHVIPIRLDLAAPANFKLADLSTWLRRNLRVVIQQKKYGVGPTPNTHVRCCVSNEEVREINIQRTMTQPSATSNTEPTVIAIIASGTPEFMRYALADHWLRYWTGTHRTERGEHARAMLYATASDAVEAAHKLLMVDYTDLVMRHFEVPLNITVYGEPVPDRDLQQYLIHACKVLVKWRKRHNGALGGAIGMVRSDVSQMKSVD
jgi:hypothetical protein